MRRPTLRKTLRWALPLIVLAVLVGHSRRVIAAATVEWAGFERLDSCYFAPSLHAAERDAIHARWLAARERVARFYGPLRAQPRIVVADAQSYPRFANGTTGVTHYLMTGRAITVVGPPGHNVDVLAHELAHAELLARIGYRATDWCVPTWFDEGLAVQFDQRPVFTEPVYFERVRAGWHLPLLVDMEGTAGFFAGTRDEVRFHYAAARVAVGRWLRSMSTDAARRSIESIDCGAAWKQRFRQIAQQLTDAAASRASPPRL